MIALVLMSLSLFAQEGDFSQRAVIDEDAIGQKVEQFVEKNRQFASVKIKVNDKGAVKTVQFLTRWAGADDLAEKSQAVVTFALSEKGKAAATNIFYVYEDRRVVSLNDTNIEERIKDNKEGPFDEK